MSSPEDGPCSLPISVKGILFDEGEVWLRKNEREEWELPGGKMGRGEQPQDAVARELQEELGFETKVLRIVHAYRHAVLSSPDESGGVLVLTYLCKILNKRGKGEPGEFKKFPVEEVFSLSMPRFYKDAVFQGAALYATLDERASTALYKQSGYALAGQ